MPAILHLLNRSVAAPFYRQHAGLGLFLFFLLFGIQPTFRDAVKTHYHFIRLILTSPSFFLFALVIWFLYTAKTLYFIRSCLQKESYDFLYGLNALPSLQRFFLLLRLQSMLMAPVTGYCFFILGVSVTDGFVPAGLAVFASLLILHLSAAHACFGWVRKGKALQQAVGIRGLFFLPPKTLFGFLLKFIFRKQLAALLWVKGFSFCSLYFFIKTDPSVFEDRMLWLIYLTAMMGHSLIVFKNFHFTETELRFYRNLPVRKWRTLLSLFGVYVVLLLPEAWALRGLLAHHGNVANYVWMIGTGPPLLSLLHCLLYTEDMKTNDYIKLLFGVWVVLFFIGLSENRWIVPAICGVSALLIFVFSYADYEKNMAVEGLE